jgi:hexokinase
MGNNTTTTATMPTYVEAMTILTNAQALLKQAYQAANTTEDKDAIFSIMEVIQDEINAFAVADIASRDDGYQAQTQWFKDNADELAAFEAKIEKYVKYVKLAGQLVDALAQVAKLAAI